MVIVKHSTYLLSYFCKSHTITTYVINKKMRYHLGLLIGDNSVLVVHVHLDTTTLDGLCLS
jgi:hypothetical protein